MTDGALREGVRVQLQTDGYEVPPGTVGTVTHVYPATANALRVRWDSGVHALPYWPHDVKVLSGSA